MTNLIKFPTDNNVIREARRRLLSDSPAPRLYFAHPQPVYGTEEEKLQLAAITNHFKDYSTINPAKIADLKIRSMQFYLDIVNECDTLVFTRFHGFVLGGVGLEAEFAIKSGKKVYELKDNELIEVKSAPNYLSYEDTVALFKKLGLRK